MRSDRSQTDLSQAAFVPPSHPDTGRSCFLPSQRDVLSLRYGWDPSSTPCTCNCGTSFSVDHAMICHMGGFPTIRHNEIRDITASLLTEACHNVATEPPLQPLDGETLTLHSMVVLALTFVLRDFGTERKIHFLCSGFLPWRVQWSFHEHLICLQETRPVEKKGVWSTHPRSTSGFMLIHGKPKIQDLSSTWFLSSRLIQLLCSYSGGCVCAGHTV